MKSLLCFFALLVASAAHADSLFGSDAIPRPDRSFDVLHYKIEIRFDQEKRKVIGTTTIKFVPLKSNLDSISLDAVEMDVKSVTMMRKLLEFSNNRKKLSVRLGRSYCFSDTLDIAVEYSCIPKKGLYFFSPDSANPKRRRQIWTQGEDMDNRNWFPCWDFPNDKATSELIATVDESWTLLSNGKLERTTSDKKNKTRTFYWTQSKPHAAYLVMFAAGEYTILKDSYKSIPVEYYSYNDKVDDTRRSLSATPAVMKFLEGATGYSYPWAKFAQIYIEDFMWGGMENTSAVTLNESYLIDQRGSVDFTADDVVAHECAHQWFGDLVTCRDWSELWLNEGFANYFEGLYRKSTKGLDEFHLSFANQAGSIATAERTQGRRPVVSNDSYTANLYSKGAWVLYMLHNILGDQEFHRAISLYIHRNAFTSVSTFDLKKAIEDATGQNLDWFFAQWIYKGGSPQLTVSTAWDSTSSKVLVSISQTQLRDSITGVFRLPIDIECTTSSGKTMRSVWVTDQEETFEIPLSGKPLMIIVDKGMKNLKTLKFEKTKDEYLYQLSHAEDAIDRALAARGLKEFSSDSSVFIALRHAALTDPFWNVRKEAATYLGAMKVGGVKEAMMEISKDMKSTVRTVAVAALDKFPSTDVAALLKTLFAKDSSYLVQTACLQSLVKVDSVAALRFAIENIDMDSYRNIFRRSALRVLRTLHPAEGLSIARKYSALGNPSDIRISAMIILREAGEKDSLSRNFVIHSLNDEDPNIRKSVIRTLEMWGGKGVVAELAKRKEVEQDESVKKALQAAIEELKEK